MTLGYFFILFVLTFFIFIQYKSVKEIVLYKFNKK